MYVSVRHLHLFYCSAVTNNNILIYMRNNPGSWFFQADYFLENNILGWYVKSMNGTYIAGSQSLFSGTHVFIKWHSLVHVSLITKLSNKILITRMWIFNFSPRHFLLFGFIANQINPVFHKMQKELQFLVKVYDVKGVFSFMHVKNTL